MSSSSVAESSRSPRALVQATVVGALGGAALGAVTQGLYSFPPDVTVAALAELSDRLGRGAVIGAGAWAGLAVAFALGWEWAGRGATRFARTARWSGAALVTLLGGTVVLWLAGRFALGFSRDFALQQALYLTGPGGCGAWVMGALRKAY